MKNIQNVKSENKIIKYPNEIIVVYISGTDTVKYIVPQPSNEIWFTSINDEIPFIEYTEGSNPVVDIKMENGLGKIIFQNPITTYSTDEWGDPGIYRFLEDEGSSNEFQKITSLSFPNSVTYIGKQAFSSSWTINIETITLSESLTSFPYFGGNWSSLKKIIIPKSVKTFNTEYAFSGCYGLEELDFGAVERIESGFSLGSCSNLKKVILPDTLTYISEDSENMFGGCRANSIKLSNNLTKLPAGFFGGCSNLTSIIIPNSVVEIEQGTPIFSGCTSLTSVILSNNLTCIPSYTLSTGASGIQLQGELVIPNSVVELGEEAFSGTTLTSIVLSDNISKIGSKCFSTYTSGWGTYECNISSIKYKGIVYTTKTDLLTALSENNVEFDADLLDDTKLS